MHRLSTYCFVHLYIHTQVHTHKTTSTTGGMVERIDSLPLSRVQGHRKHTHIHTHTHLLRAFIHVHIHTYTQNRCFATSTTGGMVERIDSLPLSRVQGTHTHTHMLRAFIHIYIHTYIHTYTQNRCFATSTTGGMVERIDSLPLSRVLAEYGKDIQRFLRQHHPSPNAPYGIAAEVYTYIHIHTYIYIHTSTV